MKLSAEIQNGVKGRYLVSVVDKDGNERFPLGTELRDNLILDRGINKLLQTSTNTSWHQHLTRMFDACQVGTGSTAAAVTDTALQTLVKTNSSIGVATGANGTTYDTGVGSAIHKRTFEFLTETGTVNYREVGFKGVSGQGLSDLLWSRVVFPSNVTVNSGEQIRVVYELTQVMSLLVTPKSTSLSSGTFNGEGDIKVVGTFARSLGFVAADGSLYCFPIASTSDSAIGSLFVAPPAQIWSGTTYGLRAVLLNNSTFPTVNTALSPSVVARTAIDTTGLLWSWSTLATSDAYRDLTVSAIGPTVPTTTQNVRSLLVTVSGSADVGVSGLMWLFDVAQSKELDYRLTFTIRVSWARL